MRVSVFGLGYVGCVTAACLAKAGHQVIGVDITPEKVVMLNDAVPPVVEPGLGEVLAEVVWDKRLRAIASTENAVKETELALVCVGTPSRSNGRLDITAVERVAHEIGAALASRSDPFTVVLRSTVLPGTTEQVFLPALLSGAGRALDASLRIAVNPEFMREGSALKDFAQPPLTLAGTDDDGTAEQLRKLYAGVESPFVQTTIRTAEMLKYVSNTFHALKIAFANEIGDVCAAFGVDPQELMRIFMMDRKLNISEMYLRPGFAFGGSCLPKDLRALIYAARSADVALPLLSSILPSNDGQIREQVDAVLKTRKRKVGIVGLSFKPATDDLRESPMVTLAETLIGKGCDVRILDRNVSLARLMGANRRYIEEEIPHISSLMCENVEELLAHAEVIVIGNADAEAAAALDAATPLQVVIDLTRGMVRKKKLQRQLETAA
ncbi:MAG TPA: nucleotide sugar dehydrogenase [Candidatus Binatia bacterium]|nr:nucleotide sugar dehydrogenase [Candidatus Binatia bacterium]